MTHRSEDIIEIWDQCIFVQVVWWSVIVVYGTLDGALSAHKVTAETFDRDSSGS